MIFALTTAGATGLRLEPGMLSQFCVAWSAVILAAPPDASVVAPAGQPVPTVTLWQQGQTSFAALTRDNQPAQWLIALGLIIVVAAGLFIARAVIAGRLKALSARHQRDALALLGRLVAKTHAWFLVVLALNVGIRGALVLPATLDRAWQYVLVIAVALQLAAWVNELVVTGVEGFLRRRQKQSGATDGELKTTMIAVRFIALIVVYALIAVLAADNLGFNVTALITGLGIGGIAVALAVQNILGDLFGALAIVSDRPFVVGDFIVVGDKMGTVESIGMKTTRLRALSGEMLIFSNSDLLKSRIQNFKQMYKRRVAFTFGVVYSTPLPALRTIPAMVTAALEPERDQITFDRANFTKLGESALEFEAVYFVNSGDYNLYAAIHERVLLRLMEALATAGIEFAFPTRTLYVPDLARLAPPAPFGGPNGFDGAPPPRPPMPLPPQPHP